MRFLFHVNRELFVHALSALFLPSGCQTETTPRRLKTSCHAAVTFLHNFPSNFDRNALTCWLSRTFSHTAPAVSHSAGCVELLRSKKVLHMAELKKYSGACYIAARRYVIAAMTSLMMSEMHFALLAGCCQPIAHRKCRWPLVPGCCDAIPLFLEAAGVKLKVASRRVLLMWTVRLRTQYSIFTVKR
jgi:hypothetical protein